MNDIDFEKIIENNKAMIYRLCRIYAVTPVEPVDLFQEVVYQVWKSKHSFKGDAYVGTWIYRIALNVCMSFKLKLEKRSMPSPKFDGIVFQKNQNNSVEEEKYNLLKECIQNLNEGDTSIILLYLEDLPYKEISKITGLSENHVAVKMKRIRKKLLHCMEPKIS